MDDPTPTPVPTSLLVQLIHTINNNTAEVTKLSAKVDQLAKDKRELALDVACMSKGINEFKDRFEPYLVDAIDNQKMWQGWRRDWFKMTIGAALICAGGFAMYVVGEVVITWVAQGLAARAQK